jgi:AcrR family transcriptional regulator
MIQQRKSTKVRQLQIVAAARKLIVKYGSEHLTVRLIAKEVGVTEGALYRHFKSKRDILAFLLDETESILISDLHMTEPNMLTMERLEQIVKAHIGSVEQRSGMTFQVIAEVVSLGDKKLNKRASAVIENYLKEVKNILSEGVKTGAIRKDIDLDAAAILFFGVIQSLVHLWAMNNYNFDLENKFSSVWRVFATTLKNNS